MTKSGLLCDPDELVGLMQAGDLEALDRITRCFADRLLAVGRRRCRNDDDARDAVQDTLLQAGQHLRDFRGEGSLEGWLVRMVANACHRMRRGRKNDAALHDTEAVLRDGAGSPEEQVAVGQLTEALGDVLGELSPDDRLLVLLADGEGWTGPEIAERLGITPGAARVRLHRARARARERFLVIFPEVTPDGSDAMGRT